MTRNQVLYAKKRKPNSSFVMAMFERGAVSFRLSATATLGDVAERVGDIGTSRIGAPVAIDVTFNPAAKDCPSRAAPYLGTPERLWR
jgi:hypothetical protein